ncbi:hypothetical protein G7075_04335 [Phycicoccus sp. HDW14]|uniref:hypothetical protein n=1 Tax=Phycicoccus sp. HDW14 TaxID=2714941 RepID=UPI00140B225A|nr:hypothetical protein [Phycicoccus sp. HDW14]QIM20546.1 hypothetical protein G7075_04335 [Phycicoccus sp. HDW14]
MYSEGFDAIELAESAGYVLDAWQKAFIVDGLGVGPEGRWSASEVAQIVSRQNGKSHAIEVLILAALFLLDRDVIYTAHKDQTAKKLFNRVKAVIESTPDLLAELAPNGIRLANGERGLTLRSGRTAEFRTRTNQGGRGTSWGFLILDEAQDLTALQLQALMPMLSAHPDPQQWFLASAGGAHSVVLGNVVRDYENGMKGLTYYGWHANEDDDFGAPAVWERTNPGYPDRVTPSWCATEYRRLGAGFAMERLGIGDYPRAAGEDWVIPKSKWDEASDRASQIVGPIVLVPDAKPDLEWSSLAVAGRRADGRMHVEVIRHDRGVGWMAPAIQKQTLRNNVTVMIDPKSPASFLVADLVDLDVTVKHQFSVDDVRDACSWLHRGIATKAPVPGADDPPPSILHTGGADLTAALASASTRPLLDKWAWKRQGAADISPLVAATQAGWGVVLLERDLEKDPPPPPVRATGGESRRTPPERRTRRTRDVDVATAGF